MGTSVLLSHLKTLAQLFMSIFKVAKLALNHTRFSLVCLQYVCVWSVMSPAVLCMAHRIEFIFSPKFGISYISLPLRQALNETLNSQV